MTTIPEYHDGENCSLACRDRSVFFENSAIGKQTAVQGAAFDSVYTALDVGSHRDELLWCAGVQHPAAASQCGAAAGVRLHLA